MKRPHLRPAAVIVFSAVALVGCAPAAQSADDATTETNSQPPVLAAGVPLAELLPDEADFEARFNGAAGIESGPQPFPTDAGFDVLELYALGAGLLTEDLVGPECAAAGAESGESVATREETALIVIRGPWSERADANVSLVRFSDPGAARRAVEKVASTVETCLAQSGLYPALAFLNAMPTEVDQAAAYSRDGGSDQEVILMAWTSDLLVTGRAVGLDSKTIDQAVQLVLDTVEARATK